MDSPEADTHVAVLAVPVVPVDPVDPEVGSLEACSLVADNHAVDPEADSPGVGSLVADPAAFHVEGILVAALVAGSPEVGNLVAGNLAAGPVACTPEVFLAAILEAILAGDPVADTHAA